MSLFTSLYGSGAGAPIGSIVAGNVSPGGDWLALDNTVYNKADYPELDTSKMLTFDGQSVVTGPTLVAGSYRVVHVTGQNWLAHNTASASAYRSADNGVTWTAFTLPGNPAGYWYISIANGVLFQMSTQGGTATYYRSIDNGANWTTHNTLPRIQSWAGMAYFKGHYYALPALNASTAGYAYSLDGVTWNDVAFTGGTTNIQFEAYSVGYANCRAPQNADVLLAPFSYVGGTYQQGAYQIYGPNSWTLRYGFTLTGAYTVAQAYLGSAREDAYGNLVNGFMLVRGDARSSYLSLTSSSAGFPLSKSNLWASGSQVSEDHGQSVAFTSTVAPNFGNGRILQISGSGVVTWMDVSTTKFRAARLPTSMTDFPQTLHIKAR